MNGITRKGIIDRRNLTTIVLQVVTIIITIGVVLWPFTTRLESRLTALEVKVEQLQQVTRDIAARALEMRWGR